MTRAALGGREMSEELVKELRANAKRFARPQDCDLLLRAAAVLEQTQDHKVYWKKRAETAETEIARMITARA